MRAAVALLLIVAAGTAPAKPCDSSEALTEGVPAPCRGILIPRARALRCLRVERVDLPRCLGDLERERRLRATGQREADAVLRACQDEVRAMRRIAEEATDHTVGRPWYEHPAMLLVTGVVVGGLATYGVVQLIE